MVTLFTEHLEREPAIVYHPDYVCPLPPGHRFPMGKFSILHDILRTEGLARDSNTLTPEPARVSDLELAHDPDYIQSFLKGTLSPQAVRRIGLPWSTRLVQRTITAVGGTMLAARTAVDKGLCLNTAGGTHHAHPDFGSGFCIFNDLAVAACYALRELGVRRLLVLDLDVHQGDGTAVALKTIAGAFTASMHCGKNFPFRKAESDLDRELAVGLDDAAYARELEGFLTEIGKVTDPELVLYDAGVDVHSRDLLGKLKLTDAGVFERDRVVIEHYLGAGVPLCGVIGGGYSKDIHALADRHAILHRAARFALARLD